MDSVFKKPLIGLCAVTTRPLRFPQRVPGVCAILLVFLLATSFSVRSQEPWDGAAFSSDPAQMLRAVSGVKVTENADVVFLVDSHKYRFEEDGRNMYTHRRVYAILTQPGTASWDSVGIGWEPWHEKRPSIRAHVITPDAVVHALDQTTLEDAAVQDYSPAVYNDRHVLRAPLPAVRVGAVVESEIVVEESTPYFPSDVARRCYFGLGVPIQHSLLEIDYPSKLALKYVAQLLPNLRVHKRETAGRTVLTLENGPIEAIAPPEPLAPAELQVSPQVDFSTGDSWSQVAQRYGQIVDVRLRSAELKTVVEQATAGVKGRQEIAAALLQYLHREVRYTGVEFGDATRVPRTPAEVLKRKYGDCKDKATLLVALLRQAGIPAHLALLAVGDGEDVPREVPGLGLFDHAIVYVPGSPDLWIDATAEWWRLGDLPPTDQGRLALVISPETTNLVATPMSSSAANRVLETRDFYLSELGPARVVENSLTWGSFEASYRQAYGVEKDSRKKELEQYMESAYLAEQLNVYSHSAADDFAQPFTLHLEAEKAKRGVTTLTSAAVVLAPLPLFSQLPEYLRQSDSQQTAGQDNNESKPGRRKTDMVLPEPFVYEIHYRIEAPNGFRPNSVPANATRHFGPCVLTEEFTTEKSGIVTALIRFDTVKQRFAPQEVEEIKSAIHDYTKHDTAFVGFEQVGQADLDAGKIREALQEFNSLIKLHPKEALHHSQLARALLVAGIGDAARDEARRATLLEPKSAQAFGTLGWALQHDLIGRRYGKGFDPEGAAAAYRKARALDPSDAAMTIDLAILLEHGSDGVRYSPTARLSEAIELYNSVKDKLEEFSVGDNLLLSLAWAGRFTELRQTVKTMPSTPNRVALALASIAVTESSSAAISESRVLAPDDQNTKAALASAGETLLQFRLYPQAADLLAASARASQDAGAVLARAEMVRHVHRREETVLSESDPRTVVLRLIYASISPKESDRLFELFSRYSVKEEDKKQILEQFKKMARAGRDALTSTNVNIDFLADLTSSIVQISEEGNDNSGYVMRVQAPDTPVQTLFVVREDDRYKILADFDQFVIAGTGGVGNLVLQLLQSGNLDVARNWLDRSRDEIKLPGGDDPFGGPPFPRFWTKGDNADVAKMRYAAAALLAPSSFWNRAVSLLLEGQSRSASVSEALNFDAPLAIAYTRGKRYNDALPVCERLVSISPTSNFGFWCEILALRGLQRYRQWEQAARDRQKRLPGDADAIRSLAAASASQGESRRAAEFYAQLISAGKAEPGDFNNMAWDYLMAGDVSQEAIGAAERSVLLTGRKKPPMLHTLACLYAGVGRTSEARDLLLKVMELDGLEEPNANVWYGFGRIAEQYGMNEAAVAAYGRVQVPEDKASIPDSTYLLAQRRRTIMQKTISASAK